MAESIIQGRFVWQELMTTDPTGAAAFYGKLAGWHAHPSAGDSGYIEFGTDSSHVAGMMKAPDGAHPGWLPYISSADVDATVASAEKLGGKVVRAATDMPDIGRFAVLTDPQGAAFALFKPAHPGAPPSNSIKAGEFAWLELATTDYEAAFAFYAELFGWQVIQRMDMGPGGMYLIFGDHGVQRGGIYRLQQQKAGPHWLPYIEVADADAAATTASAAGGRVVNGPMDVPGGRIVQLLDPSGVLIAVHTRKATASAPKPAAKKAAPKSAGSTGKSNGGTTKSTASTDKGPPGPAVKPAPTSAPPPKKPAALPAAKPAAKKAAKKPAKSAAKSAPKKAVKKAAKKVAKKAVKKVVKKAAKKVAKKAAKTVAKKSAPKAKKKPMKKMPMKKKAKKAAKKAARKK